MTMTISGDGTISGLVAGGLPNATVQAADLAANAVDAQALSLLNASGSAPVYACRAWVNFNGTGTVAIRGSGNVSSITDYGTGDFGLNFSSALPDGNYSQVVSAGSPGVTSGGTSPGSGAVSNNTTTQSRVFTFNTAFSAADFTLVCVAIFR